LKAADSSKHAFYNEQRAQVDYLQAIDKLTGRGICSWCSVMQGRHVIAHDGNIHCPSLQQLDIRCTFCLKNVVCTGGNCEAKPSQDQSCCGRCKLPLKALGFSVHREDTGQCESSRERVLPLIVFAMKHCALFKASAKTINAGFNGWRYRNYRIVIGTKSENGLLYRYLRGEGNALAPDSTPWCVWAMRELHRIIFRTTATMALVSTLNNTSSPQHASKYPEPVTSTTATASVAANPSSPGRAMTYANVLAAPKTTLNLPRPQPSSPSRLQRSHPSATQFPPRHGATAASMKKK
jgi:hypothetical protein